MFLCPFFWSLWWATLKFYSSEVIINSAGQCDPEHNECNFPFSTEQDGKAKMDWLIDNLQADLWGRTPGTVNVDGRGLFDVFSGFWGVVVRLRLRKLLCYHHLTISWFWWIPNESGRGGVYVELRVWTLCIPLSQFGQFDQLQSLNSYWNPDSKTVSLIHTRLWLTGFTPPLTDCTHHSLELNQTGKLWSTRSFRSEGILINH